VGCGFWKKNSSVARRVIDGLRGEIERVAAAANRNPPPRYLTVWSASTPKWQKTARSECAHFTPQAEIDLEEVGDSIALDNPGRAVSFIRASASRRRFQDGGPAASTYHLVLRMPST